MSSLLILDAETSGLSPHTAGIVELAAVAIQDGAVVSEWSSLAWPGFPFIKEPTHHEVLARVSGISPALLLDAPDLEEVGRAFLNWGMKALGELPLPVTSYNRAFDEPFVKAHLPYVQARLRWGECLMLRAMRHLAVSRWTSLARTCELLGIEQGEAHRALSDARAGGQIWLALEERD